MSNSRREDDKVKSNFLVLKKVKSLNELKEVHNREIYHAQEDGDEGCTIIQRIADPSLSTIKDYVLEESVFIIDHKRSKDLK